MGRNNKKGLASGEVGTFCAPPILLASGRAGAQQCPGADGEDTLIQLRDRAVTPEAGSRCAGGGVTRTIAPDRLSTGNLGASSRADKPTRQHSNFLQAPGARSSADTANLLPRWGARSISRILDAGPCIVCGAWPPCYCEDTDEL